jgi:hypothetical protein
MRLISASHLHITASNHHITASILHITASILHITASILHIAASNHHITASSVSLHSVSSLRLHHCALRLIHITAPHHHITASFRLILRLITAPLHHMPLLHCVLYLLHVLSLRLTPAPLCLIPSVSHHHIIVSLRLTILEIHTPSEIHRRHVHFTPHHNSCTHKNDAIPTA